MPPYEKEALVAQSAVLCGANISKVVLNMPTRSLTKSDASPVTVADYAIQSLMITTLHHYFPEDGFIGEEDAEALRLDPDLRGQVWSAVSGALHDMRDPTGKWNLLVEPRDQEEMMDMIDLGGNGEGGRKGRWWVMDPIDGTKTFMKGQQYAVNLALIEDGVEVLGVLGVPNLPECSVVSEQDVDRDGLGIMMSAVKGQGVASWRVRRGGIPEPLPGLTAPAKAPEDSREWQIVDCYSSTTQNHAAIRELARRLDIQKKPGIDLFSSHVRYTSLVVSPNAVNVRYPLPGNRNMLWDHAGANLILREMGFTITDLNGKDIDFGAGRDLKKNRGFIIARSNIHQRVFEVVQGLLKEY